ncbi:hypothetical protein GDV60_21095 [Pseudomonas sp. DTU12.1]|nr:hypothetical protein GDV60_21095 [Pseudomonas sp. DTU12.1]
MLAKIVNADAGILDERGALKFFASKLAPAGLFALRKKKRIAMATRKCAQREGAYRNSVRTPTEFSGRPPARCRLYPRRPAGQRIAGWDARSASW